MSTLKRVTHNSIWLLAANIITKLIGTFTTVLVARYLGDTGLGQYSFAIAFVGFFAIMTNFGFDNLLIREISRNKKHTQDLVGNVTNIKIFLSFITLLLLSVIVILIDKPDIVKILIIIFGFDLIITSLKSVMADAFQGHELIKYNAISNILEKALWAFALIFILRFDLGITSLALSTLITAVIGTAYLYFIYRRNFGSIKLLYDRIFWKKLFIQAWPFALTGIFLMINWKVDLIMLSFYQTDAVVGWYSAPYRLLELLMIAPSILMTAIYPVLSRLAKHNKKKMLETLRSVLRFLLIIMIPITIGVLFLGDKIITLIYGGQFINSVIAFKILIFATLFAFVNYPLLFMLNAMGEQKRGTINAGISSLVNISLNFLLIPALSYVGASITTVISEALFLTLSYTFIVSKGFSIRISSIFLKPLIAGIIMAVFLYFFTYLNIFLLIIIAAIVYMTCILLLKEITSEDINMFKEIIRKKS